VVYGATGTKLNRDVAMVSERLDEPNGNLHVAFPLNFFHELKRRTHDTARG